MSVILENHPVTSIDDFLLEEFAAAEAGTVGIRDGLVGNLHHVTPITTFSLQTSGTCLEQESGSWNQSPVGGLQSWDLKSLTKILLGAANGHTITIIALYLAFNCSATSLAGLHRFLQNHTLFVYSPNCWE